MLEVSDALGGPGRVPGATAGMNGVDTSLLCDLLQALTFLTRNEILCIHDTFLKLCPPGKYYKEATLTMDQVSSLPALRLQEWLQERRVLAFLLLQSSLSSTRPQFSQRCLGWRLLLHRRLVECSFPPSFHNLSWAESHLPTT
eukprot:XP_024308460.1 calcium and integrin-binding family member 4 isoform X3 [Homo sapiens]